MKVCVICFDFRKENLRRQPWRYIYELSEGLAERGFDVVIITNGDANSIDNLKIKNVRKISSFLGETQEVLEILEKEKPEVVIMLLGLTSFLRLNFRINYPVIGILTSPIYYLSEILNVGFQELKLHYNYILPHLIGSLIPSFLIRRYAKHFEYIVVLSKENMRRLKNLGVKTKIKVIPPGVDKFFLGLSDLNKVRKLRMKINPEGNPVILYFGSPLTLRGTDTLIKGFSEVRIRIPSKLLFLLRLDHQQLVTEEELLKNIARKCGASDAIIFMSKYLIPTEVKEYLTIADIVCLPFKIVISDVPISILEAMCVGKPVISTSIGCIPEILAGKGIVIDSNNPMQLAEALIKLLNDKEKAYKLGDKCRNAMYAYPRWTDYVEKFMELIRDTARKNEIK